MCVSRARTGGICVSHAWATGYSDARLRPSRCIRHKSLDANRRKVADPIRSDSDAPVLRHGKAFLCWEDGRGSSYFPRFTDMERIGCSLGAPSSGASAYQTYYCYSFAEAVTLGPRGARTGYGSSRNASNNVNDGLMLNDRKRPDIAEYGR
jgi:hypothetical protein